MQVLEQTTNQAELLARELNAALELHSRVIWLVPGGSNIPISVAASRLINLADSKKLIIMQTDERFVAPDHPDCNWLQLTKAGFDVKKATALPILTSHNAGLKETVQKYDRLINQEFSKAGYVVGQFGVGADGHIAGIKPESSATDSPNYVAGFEGDDFIRITLTFRAMRQINQALTFAYGSDKAWVFSRLAEGQPSSLTKFPAGILMEIKNSKLYNDQVSSIKTS